MVSLDEKSGIFKQVSISDKKFLFKKLVSSKTQITIRGLESESVFHLIPIQLEKFDLLFCHQTAGAKDLATVENVLLSFVVDNEKYFLQGGLNIEVGWVILNIQDTLFQLHRRANVRFELPTEYPGIFIITRHLEKSFFVDGKIIDISAGGLKMEVPGTHPEITVGQIIRGSLRLGKRRPIESQIEVKFVMTKGQGDKKHYILGGQFLRSSTQAEGRLLNLMIDLQRELFIKYS